ncbi:MAG: hypothetical protein ACTTJ6_00830 [Treponema sp.]
MQSQNIFDNYNKVESLLEHLYTCTKKEQIDTLFEESGIVDFKARNEILNKRMGVIETFGTPEKISDEEMYELTRFAFVEGSWRLLN